MSTFVSGREGYIASICPRLAVLWTQSWNVSTSWTRQQHARDTREVGLAEAACLRRGFGRQAKLDAAIAANLRELGYGG